MITPIYQLCICLCLFIVTSQVVYPNDTTVKYATLKFDDLCPHEDREAVKEIEQQTYELLHSQGIPHAWGVCRLGDGEHPGFYQWLKDRHAEGHEIWHHGNHHDRVEGESWEFKNRDAASQRENLRFTQERVYEKAGIVLRTFGAPYNKTDEATGRVLNEIDALQVMYFAKGSPNFAGLQLNERVNLESKTGVVATMESFKESYAKKENAELIVLQAHPAYWKGDEDLQKLQAILDFLKDEGREFITPWNYYQLKHAASDS